MLARLKLFAFSIAMAFGSMAAAESLPQPTGDVILTISGALSNTNSGSDAVFDLAMLEALPQRTTVTSTPWYEGAQTFTGPTIADILAAVGATGATLRLVALNDYASDMPVQDTLDSPVILATRLNGNLLPVREKGPLFTIYPFDEHPELLNEVYFTRSVWQVKAIEVLAE
jgi:hypothetical protein